MSFIILPAHVYNLIVIPRCAGTNSWNDPVRPALVPAYPPNATPEQMEEIRATHKEQIRCWKLCANVNTALRTQLLQAIQPIYVRALRSPHTGYAHVSVRNMLQYLFAHYGRILPHQLATNDTQFRKEWNPIFPL